MRTLAIIVLLTATSASLAFGQHPVRIFAVGGVSELRAVRHQYTDVSQYGGITAIGGGMGISFRTEREVGVEVTFEHYQSGKTQVYDFFGAPTGDYVRKATLTTLGIASRIGRGDDPINFRVGAMLSGQGGDVMLGGQDMRLGVHGGVVARPFRLGRIAPALQLGVTRYVGGEAGIAWVLAPALRVEFGTSGDRR